MLLAVDVINPDSIVVGLLTVRERVTTMNAWGGEPGARYFCVSGHQCNIYIS